MKLAEKLVSLRKAKGLTQMKVAESLEVSRQAVSRWEVGDAVPSTENLKCLSILFGVPIDYLVNDADVWEQNCVGNAVAKEKEKPKRKMLMVGVCFSIFILALAALYLFFAGEQIADGKEDSIRILEEEQLEDEPDVGFELEW